MTADQILPEAKTSIQRDLKLNFHQLQENGALDATELALATLTAASVLDFSSLAQKAEETLKSLDLTEEQITEARESAAIMGMLNTYYRFRHLLSEESQPEYARAGLRMNSLGKPALGKERFEMLAFTASVLNGCQTCVDSHEKALRKEGVSVDKIHDLARLASVVKGLERVTSG